MRRRTAESINDALLSGTNVAPERVVQTESVGNSPSPRRRKAREVQGLKKVIKEHMSKLSNDLRV